MADRQGRYVSYLLRLWLVEDDGPTWRASLENPTTAERRGFASLEKLFAFVVAKTRDLAAEDEWGQEPEPTSSAGEGSTGTGPDRAFLDLLSRGVTDEEFRSLLLADPARALRDGGYDLTMGQLTTLLATDRGGVAESLDQRLAKSISQMLP